MAWGDPGKTVRRNITDQVQSVVSISTANLPIPFVPLRTVGYLSGFYIYTPLATQAATHGTGTTTLATGLNFPQLKSLFRVQVNLQASVNLVDVRGITLADLAYIGSGRRSTDLRESYYQYGYSVLGAAPSTNQFPWSFPSLVGDTTLIGWANQFIPYIQYVQNAATWQYAFAAYVPITEWLTWPNAIVGQAGQVQIANNLLREFGLIYMQSDQQNLSPFVTQAAIQGATNESVFQTTGNDVISAANLQWTIETEYYDVPPNPADRPDALQSRYIITRQEQDAAVAGQAVSIRHRPAGMLLAVIYRGYNDSGSRGTVVDLTQTQGCLLQVKSGTTDIKLSQNANQNAHQSFMKYGMVPPGILVADFRDDTTITQQIDTGQTVEVRSDLTGLPATCTRVAYTEIRAIPVRRPTMPQASS